MNASILTIPIATQDDVVTARQMTRQVAGRLGLESVIQTYLATAVSEIARNALSYAGRGKVELLVDMDHNPQTLLARVSDRGPGIANVTSAMQSTARAAGASTGLAGARRLVDVFEVDSLSGAGTTVVLGMHFPKHARRVSRREVSAIADELLERVAASPLEELRQQNQSLIQALEELQARREEAERLNGELEETNRGVVALYADLEDKVAQLKVANELKMRFISYVSHEFRTPIHAMLALTQILLDETDGTLTEEQTRQVSYIRSSTATLLEMANDLLDLARVDAGKVAVSVSEFQIADVFSALRGMFRPLLHTTDVDLIFTDASEIPPIQSDEGKVSQVLRNLIGNALKFTEQGAVTVSARQDNERDQIILEVRDTGIGIAEENQERIFEEFSQVESAHPVRVRGTGLGLPLSRRLARVLGGDVTVESQLGSGSTFRMTVPRRLKIDTPRELGIDEPMPGPPPALQRESPLVLIVDDDELFRYVLRSHLQAHGYRCIEATGIDALRIIRQEHPDAVTLDLLMPEITGFEILSQLREDRKLSALPVVVITSKALDRDELQTLHAQAGDVLSKGDLTRESVNAAIANVMRSGSSRATATA